MKKRVLLVIITVLAGSGIIFTGCQSDYTIRTESLIDIQDLKEHDLFIHNVTCSGPFEVRTVADDDFLDKVIALCLSAEQFRPSISTDSVAGAVLDVYFILVNTTDKYTFSFFEVEEQLNIGFIHRDKPVFCIEKALKNESGNYKKDWSWFCTLPASNFASLYELVQTYTGGEVVYGVP